MLRGVVDSLGYHGYYGRGNASTGPRTNPKHAFVLFGGVASVRVGKNTFLFCFVYMCPSGSYLDKNVSQQGSECSSTPFGSIVCCVCIYIYIYGVFQNLMRRNIKCFAMQCEATHPTNKMLRNITINFWKGLNALRATEYAKAPKQADFFLLQPQRETCFARKHSYLIYALTHAQLHSARTSNVFPSSIDQYTLISSFTISTAQYTVREK